MSLTEYVVRLGPLVPGFEHSKPGQPEHVHIQPSQLSITLACIGLCGSNWTTYGPSYTMSSLNLTMAQPHSRHV